MINEKRIKYDIDQHLNHLFMVNLNYRGDPLTKEMYSNKRYSDFFHNDNKELLYCEYIKKIGEVSKQICSSDYTAKQKVANLLEYMRMFAMYENHDTYEVASEFSQSGLNIALLQKGVCKSQVCFFRDVLNNSGMDAIEKPVDLGANPDDLEIHEICIADMDGQITFIDPTWYNGKPKSLVGSFEKISQEDKDYCDKLTVGSLSLSEEDITQARELVQNILIGKLGIDKISEQLKLSQKNELDKQMIILAYLEKHMLKSDLETSSRSVLINGYEIEAGKAIELFFKSNDIPCELISANGDKKDSMISTKLFGKVVYLLTNKIYNKNNRIGKYLHINPETKELLYKEDPEIEKKFAESIKGARKIIDCSFDNDITV